MKSLLRVSRLPFVAALAGLSLIAVGVPRSQGADPFVAGGRSTRPVVLPPSQADLAKAHGRRLAAALGLPGVVQRAERLDDRFDHRTYDEVTSVDSAGRDVAIARFETDGKVAMAVALGWHPGHGQPIDGTGAVTRAHGTADAAGIAVVGEPTISSSAGSGGWSVAWPRIVDGAPVRGDGVRIALWPDGSFHGLTRLERPLASRPDHPLSAGTARKAAEAWAAVRYGSSATGLRVVTVDRAWIAPNDTFAVDRADAPAETLRLAWVVAFEARGALAERVRSVEVWLDAGDGAVLGGDLVE
jgi:hypothetical protein